MPIRIGMPPSSVAKLEAMPEAEDVTPIEDVEDVEDTEDVDAEQPDTQDAQDTGKVSPLLVHYKDGATVMSEQCQGCVHFLQPSQCHIVSGEIDPDGVCNLFSAGEEEPETEEAVDVAPEDTGEEPEEV